jgi:hypothetical protein
MSLFKHLGAISATAAANGREESILDQILLFLLFGHVIVNIVDRVIIQSSIGVIQPHDTEGNEEVH